MAKWCLNYESGEYELIERDGFRVESGDIALNWDDSEYRREEEEKKNDFFRDRDDG